MKKASISLFQFQYLLEDICPNIYFFIPKDSFSWQRINQKYSEKHHSLELNLKFHIEVEVSFIELLFLNFVKREKMAEDLLILLNKSFGIINGKIKSNDLKSQFKKGTINKLLEEPGSNYLNFMGEILCLANILNLPGYELIAIEQMLPNGKKFDFGIYNKEFSNDNAILVEILNIHIKPNEIFVEQRITKKIEDKIQDKLKNMPEDEVVNLNYSLIPIIWCNGEKLKEIQQLLKLGKLEFSRIIDVFSVVRTIHYNGESYFSFGSIKEMYLK